MIYLEGNIKKEISDISNIIKKGSYKEALQKFNILESKYPENINIRLSKVGTFIDAGSGLKDKKIINKGIKIGIGLLNEKAIREYLSILNYNIANGYMSLYEISRREYEGIKQIPDNENLQSAKKHYRVSIKHKHLLDYKLEKQLGKQLWTNYGNCLDTLGRNMEALFIYENALRVDPKFSMALGNKAIAMKFFADISGEYRAAIYIESYQMLKSAVKQRGEIIEYGNASAKRSFKREIKKIESIITNKEALSTKIKHNKYSKSKFSKFEKFYIDFCSEHKLFLNFHIHVDKCEASISDPIFIRLITPIGDKQTFNNLAKYINQIKEDFAVARLLLVLSKFKRRDFNRISERTLFACLADYSMFNLYIGLLKSAFKEAFNILDKIAVFINDYLKNENNLGKIYFDKSNFWQKKNKIKKIYLNTENISLYALYDIFLDFKNKYYQKIRNIRNALTHRKLVIYNTNFKDLDNSSNSTEIIYNTMFNETINLFRMVKSAIIYLINFVELEERKKRIRSKNSIIPIFFNNYKFLED